MNENPGTVMSPEQMKEVLSGEGRHRLYQNMLKFQKV